MDSEELRAERDRLEAYLDLFGHPQWKVFQAELAVDLGFLKDITTISTAEAFHSRKGEVRQLLHILGFEQMVRAQLEALAEEQADVEML